MKQEEACKNQIMLGKYVVRGLRVEEPLINLQKYLKKGFSLLFLIHPSRPFKDDLD